MMALSLDSLTVISIALTIYGTIYFCSKVTNSTIKKFNSYYNNMKSSDNKLKKISSRKSFSDFDIFFMEDKDTFIDKEESQTSKSTSAIQSSKLCNRCNRHLNNYNTVDYFAFDKQFCKYCWLKINNRISNS